MSKVVSVNVAMMSHLTLNELAVALGISVHDLRHQLRKNYPGMSWPSKAVNSIRKKIKRSKYPANIRRMELKIVSLLPETVMIQITQHEEPEKKDQI